MRYDPDRHHRRSIRLRGYDYTRAGAYFVTICIQGRDCLLGDIVNGNMRLNDAGRMVQTVWDELPQHYSGVDIDAFVVMPNHIHGIILLTVGATPRGCPLPHDRPVSRDGLRGQAVPGVCRVSRDHRGSEADDDVRVDRNGQARGPAPTDTGVATGRLSLPDVVHRFKSLTTARYSKGVGQDGWAPFPGKLWQRNYHEHIIRDEDELRRAREYIAQNPARWALDRENPYRENRVVR